MDLKNYIHLLKKYLFIIIFFVTFITITSSILVFVIPPVYKASTTLMVNQATSDVINLNDIMTSERLAQTYAQIITKRPVIEKVNKQLNLGLKYEDLIKKIEVEIIKDTQLIKISVKDTDAAKAAEIADSVSQNFSEEVITLQGEKNNYNTISIVEKAFAPDKPDSPKKALTIVLSFLISFILILTIIFLIEYLDDTFKDEFDVREYLNFPHLGTVSYIKESQRNSNNLITVVDTHNPIVESFREIRTNIQFSHPEKTTKTIIVTSANPAEGKSQITANLAVVMAQAGYKTILIDADLHRPTQHNIFNLENNYGLSDLLIATEFPKSFWQSTKINGLSVITSGTFLPNPAEWIGSTKMYQLIEKIKEKGFHSIIIDTPPIGLVTDAAILSSMVDDTIILIQTGKTSRKEAQRAIDAINKVGGNILGIILNHKRPNHSNQNKYYHYEYTEHS